MSHHILVVDDEPMLLELISIALRMDGHMVTVLADPLKAEECLAGADIDLVLTDVTMQPISGFEMVKRLTAHGFGGQVLFMSGYGAISQSMSTRAVLDKPFTAPELRKAVKRALSSAKVKGQRPDADSLVCKSAC